MNHKDLKNIVCGKYIYPQALTEARAKASQGLISEEELRSCERECLLQLVEHQVEVGIDIVSDGCILRPQWDSYFYFGLNGIESSDRKDNHIYDDRDMSRAVPNVVGKIGYNESHPIFDDYKTLCSVLPEGADAMVILPAPAQFLMWLLMEDKSWKTAYPDLVSLVADIIAAYKSTLSHLYQLGCRHILLDDRSWQRMCRRDDMKRIIQNGYDLHQLVQVLRSINDKSTEGLGSDMDLMLYLPRIEAETMTEAMASHCESISHIAFDHANVETFVLDMPDGREEEVASIIGRLPADKQLILGVVDGRHPQLESQESVLAKAKLVQSLIGSRLCAISPICGFKRDHAMLQSTGFSEEDQWKKLNLIQSVCDILNARLTNDF